MSGRDKLQGIENEKKKFSILEQCYTVVPVLCFYFCVHLSYENNDISFYK